VAVKIRLMRVGKKKQPTYRVVVADGRSPRDGRFIEIIGQYAPREEPSRVTIDGDAAIAWLRKGAQPTESVQKLLAATGVWAQYEAERSQPAVTKLSRRGYVTGKVAPGVKQPAPTAPSADAGGGAEVDEAPTAEVAADVEEAPAAEVDAGAPAAEATDTADADATESGESTESGDE
jgi:small subunit ribosomal protein S16